MSGRRLVPAERARHLAFPGVEDLAAVAAVEAAFNSPAHASTSPESEPPRAEERRDPHEFERQAFQQGFVSGVRFLVGPLASDLFLLLRAFGFD
jgi:hypothetical protein